MKYVFVLEQDQKFQNEIYEILIGIDPQLCVRFFDTAEGLNNWLKLALTDGNKSLVKGGFRSSLDLKEVTDSNPDDELMLLILCNDILGLKHKELIKKIKKSFVDHKLCKAEDPTRVILTLFDSPDLKFRQAEDKLFNNVLFKPFDKLVTQQHLICAIDGHKKPSQNIIFNMKSKAEVEMLKKITIEGVSEVGFISKSDREISIGGYSKYYGDCFASETHIGVVAKCVRCIPHPSSPKEFQVYFTYFSIHSSQLANIRKIQKVNSQKAIKTDWLEVIPSASANLIIIDPDQTTSQSLKETLERNFDGLNVLLYSDLALFLKEIDSGEIEKHVKASAKSIPFENGILNFHFDIKGVTITEVEPKISESQNFCGISMDALKKTELRSLMDKFNKEKWDKLVNERKIPSDPIFKITYSQKDFLFKINHIEQKNDKLHIQFLELSVSEKTQWYLQNSNLPKKIDGILLSDVYFGESFQEKLTGILGMIEKRQTTIEPNQLPPKIFISTSSSKAKDVRSFCGIVSELFYKPYDKAYLLKKIKIHFPKLKNKDALDFTTVLYEATVKAANPTELVEYSEASIVMKYHRAIEPDDFREFMLPAENSQSALEVLARCNFTEAATGDQKGFINHFVLFGMRDHYLKAIRLWIRENYIHSKEGKG